VMGCTPGPRIVPAGGDCVATTEPQPPAKQLENWHRLGTRPEQALALSKLMALSCRQPQFTVGGLPPVKVTLWLHVLKLPHRSVRSQVRVTPPEQRLLVTVLATVTVTLLPLH